MKEYSSEIAEIAEKQFERYVREDPEETFSDEILHGKFWQSCDFAETGEVNENGTKNNDLSNLTETACEQPACRRRFFRAVKK